MPSIRKTNTTRGRTSLSDAQFAAQLVLENAYSIREAAKAYNMHYITLYRFVKKIKNGDTPTLGYNPHTRIFSPEQEDEIVNYLLSSSDNLYDLSSFGLRRFAYLLAVQYEATYPKSWDVERIASRSWCHGFLLRHPKLSLRSRHSASTATELSVKTDNVNSFHDTLQALMRKHNFLPQDIYSLDQTGLSTCHSRGHKTAHRCKLEGDATTVKGRNVVNVALAINAIGHYVPPMFLYPRHRMLPSYLDGGPIGGVGVANCCGSTSQAHLLGFLKHFSRYAKPSLQQRILLILANRYSPFDESVVDYCKTVGIVLLSLPLECTDKLQPLDRCVFRPLQACYKAACETWLANNPGQVMRIDHVAQIVAKALPRAATPLNVMDGFRVCGIFPFDKGVCPEEAYVDMSWRGTERHQQNSPAEDPLRAENVPEGPSSEEEGYSDPRSPEMAIWVDELEVKYSAATENGNYVTEDELACQSAVKSTPLDAGKSSERCGLRAVVIGHVEGSTVAEELEVTRERRTRKSVDMSDYDVSTRRGRSNGRGRGTGRGRGRPRRVVVEQHANQEAKRGRGRPRGSKGRGGASLAKKEEISACTDKRTV